MRVTRALPTVFLTLALLTACEPADDPPATTDGTVLDDDGDGGKADSARLLAEVNAAAGAMVLYEVQVRAANACRTDTGADWQREACAAKVAPPATYRAEGMSCSSLDDLDAIRLGTIDDMLEDTADYRQGITLRYIDERVGANTVWLMPLFPNNDTWSIPDACDNTGSPYAVRDYMHVAGTHARACIEDGRDEYADEPCWGNEALDELIDDAHARGMKVMLDIALNHFGHNYLMYDYVDFSPVRDRIADGEDLDDLWKLKATEEQALIAPEILDTEEELRDLASRDTARRADLEALEARCPDVAGQDLVRAFNMWRVALDHERQQFPCDAQHLEQAVPGFYLGANHWDPSTHLGDNYSNDWRDVKFLYHHETNAAHEHEFVRDREYLFRILNYWASRGVDGFRLDHTTEGANGLAPNEWRYLLSKVTYYATKRGQARPVFLAEEFHDQGGMSKVVDVMTEGYVRDMTGRDGVTKNASHVEGILANMYRFQGRTYVMTALETHDEHRLTDGTGFDIWTGAGFWGIGATTWSTPMLLMGAEFGEPYGLGFRRSDFLRARFEGSSNWNPQGEALLELYHGMITARLAAENRALIGSKYAFLRARDSGKADERIFAQVKWSDGGNVVFVFHNLWKTNVKQSYYIPPDLGGALAIRDDLSYRLVDVFTGTAMGACRTGGELKWDLYVEMDAETRLQWLRLERCE